MIVNKNFTAVKETLFVVCGDEIVSVEGEEEINKVFWILDKGKIE